MRIRRLAFAIFLACLLAAACSAFAAEGRTQEFTISAAGHDWHCTVRVPPSYDGSKPVPLVLILHGAGGQGSLYLSRCGWADKADKAGFIAAAPDGLPARPNETPSFLNNPRLWNSYILRPLSPRASIDDIAFFKALIKELEKRYKVDTGRVYLTGHSNGAGMTFRLGAEMADTFAAIAPVASTCSVPNPKPSRPVPTLFIIGNQDKLVPVAGGESTTPWNSRITPPVATSLARWAAAIGCSAEPKAVSDKGGVKIVSYPPAKKGGVDFTACYIEGQGHNWPGGDTLLPERLVGPNNPSFHATDVIWEFFAKHPKP